MKRQRDEDEDGDGMDDDEIDDDGSWTQICKMAANTPTSASSVPEPFLKNAGQTANSHIGPAT